MPLKAPSNYRVEQSVSYHGGIAEAVLIVAFDGDPNAAYYEYQVRSNDGNYSDVKTTHLNHIEFSSTGATYTFRVRAMGWFGQRSHYSTYHCSASLEQQIPQNVSRFVSSYSDKIAVLEWAKNPELYVKHYEIRHGTAWENSILIAELNSTTLHLTQARPGFYLIKAVSQWGIKSAEASVLELTDLTPLNIIQEYDYAANDWPGEFHHTAVNNNNHIRLFLYYSWGGMTQSWEDYSDSWENTKSGTLATDISEGYYLSAVYDLGKIMRCRVYADMQISQSNDDLSFDNMQNAWSHYTLENNWSWLGSPEACGFEVQCSTSEDNQNWTEFIPLTASF